MSKIKLELTKVQFECLLDIIDTVSGTLGVGSDWDTYQGRNVKNLDKMLKANGYKRNFS